MHKFNKEQGYDHYIKMRQYEECHALGCAAEEEKFSMDSLPFNKKFEVINSFLLK